MIMPVGMANAPKCDAKKMPVVGSVVTSTDCSVTYLLRFQRGSYQAKVVNRKNI